MDSIASEIVVGWRRHQNGVPVVGQKHPRRQQKAMPSPALLDYTGQQGELRFAKVSSTGEHLAGHEKQTVA
jgi:hypothetical protein